MTLSETHALNPATDTFMSRLETLDSAMDTIVSVTDSINCAMDASVSARVVTRLKHKGTKAQRKAASNDPFDCALSLCLRAFVFNYPRKARVRSKRWRAGIGINGRDLFHTRWIMGEVQPCPKSDLKHFPADIRQDRFPYPLDFRARKRGPCFVSGYRSNSGIQAPIWLSSRLG